MNVALSLPDLTPQAGGLALETRGTVRGFRQAGHDVTLYYASELSRLAGHTEAYDLVVLPYLDRTVETGSAHLHHQFGGYGPQDLDPRLVATTVESADTISVPDPAIANKAPWFQVLDIAPDDVPMIPSPPDLDLFSPQPRDATDGTVLVPNLGTEYAPDSRCARVLRHTPTVTYRALSHEVGHELPTNVHRYPPVPVSAMPAQYATADLVFNPAQAGALPRVCYEAFCSERAYLSAPEAIGALQTLPADVVDTSAFGASVEWWRDTYRASFFEGDHYVAADTERQPEALSTMLADRDRRWAVAERGRAWVESVFGDWGWQEKAEALVELAETA